MRILIDLVHVGDVNFYKQAIVQLERNNEVVLTVLKRGKLPEIAKQNFPTIEQKVVGEHRHTKLGKLVGLVQRELAFMFLFTRQRFDRVTSFGFYPAIAAKFFGIKSVLFHDDYEYKQLFNLCQRWGDTLVVPQSVPAKGRNIVKYPGFKELAHLQGFKPDKRVLRKYGVKENRFVFVRDIESISLNYTNKKKVDFTPLFSDLNEQGIDVLYYPENGQNEYSSISKTLQPPVEGLHSLLYYSLLTISTGDGISRESALLGTPSIYLGGRDMAILKPLIHMGAVIPATPESLVKTVMGIQEINSKKLLRGLMEKKRIEWPNWSRIICEEVTK